MICCIAIDEDIAQIPQLWQTFKKAIMADFRHAGMNRQEATIALLDHIKDIVLQCRLGVTLSDLGIKYDHLGIDVAQMSSDEENDAHINENYFEGNNVPPTEYLVSALNKDQKVIFLRILNASTEQIIDRTRENLFYIDGPGGTGKTYLYNTLITVLKDILRSKMVAVAWTELGQCVLFGGDFGQILQVVLGGRRNDIIAQSSKASELWHSFTKLHLTEHMRVARHPEMTVPHDDLDKCTFGQWLLKLGEGMIPFNELNQRAALVAPDDLIEIPTRFQVSTADELIYFVYERDFTAIENGSRAILCPTNAVINEINTIIIRQIESEAKTYLSEDIYAGTDDDDFVAPLDLPNSISSPSLPPHELT
ncbi:hypothetical protein JTB14_003324 [Gonioctena quinquepunctata]|nr:hypothetical protein JTB14_003324 [Gonioctena quinquepunctata]